MQIRVDDNVEVIAGDDRGERGRVLSVDRRANTVVVEGVNRVYKHVRRSQKNPQGGRLSKEMAISAASVMLICPQCGKLARIGRRYTSDGAKERFCRKCGQTISQIAPPRPAYAKQ